MKKPIVVLAAIAMICSFCNPQKKITGNYPKEPECMGVEMDGSQTLKTWGFGSSRTDAIEQAKKNAVRDVLFKGIRNGKNECDQRPLVAEVNAQEKYEDYFNNFFKDGGPYSKFVSMKDEPAIKIPAKYRNSATDGVEYGLIVRVLRADLKKQLLSDNILKPQAAQD